MFRLDIPYYPAFGAALSMLLPTRDVIETRGAGVACGLVVDSCRSFWGGLHMRTACFSAIFIKDAGTFQTRCGAELRSWGIADRTGLGKQFGPVAGVSAPETSG